MTSSVSNAPFNWGRERNVLGHENVPLVKAEAIDKKWISYFDVAGGRLDNLIL